MDTATRTRICRMVSLLPGELGRKYAALEALGLGEDGVRAVHELTGMPMTAIRLGIGEVEVLPDAFAGDCRAGGRPRCGRKTVEELQPGISEALLSLLSGRAADSPLTWTTRSWNELARQMRGKGFQISGNTLGRKLREQGFQLHRRREGRVPRGLEQGMDAQYALIGRMSRAFLDAGAPVVFVETRRTATVEGAGGMGRVDAPFAPDELACTAGGIRAWWEAMGRGIYPDAASLLVTAEEDGDDGQGERWERALQSFADASGLEIHLACFPQGTSRWSRLGPCFVDSLAGSLPGGRQEVLETTVSIVGAAQGPVGRAAPCGGAGNARWKWSAASEFVHAAADVRDAAWYARWNRRIGPADRP